MSVQALSQSIATRLQADDGLHAYLLVDPMLYEPVDAGLLAQAGLTPKFVSVDNPRLSAHQRPWIVSLPSRAVEVMEASVAAALVELDSPHLEATQGFAVSGWLLSSDDETSVSRHLAAVMSLYEPGAGQRYLRWADRRVLEWMWPALDLGQRTRLMGPIKEWLTLDRRGEVVVYGPENEATTVADSHVGSAMLRFSLSAQQWRWAHRCEAVQQMIRGWRAFEPMLPSDYVQKASHAVAAALAMGLTEMADIVLLGAFILQIHPRLSEHSRIIDAVMEARSRAVSLGSVLERIPDPEGWDAIRAELLHAGSPAQMPTQRMEDTHG